MKKIVWILFLSLMHRANIFIIYIHTLSGRGCSIGNLWPPSAT